MPFSILHASSYYGGFVDKALKMRAILCRIGAPGNSFSAENFLPYLGSLLSSLRSHFDEGHATRHLIGHAGNDKFG